MKKVRGEIRFFRPFTGLAFQKLRSALLFLFVVLQSRNLKASESRAPLPPMRSRQHHAVRRRDSQSNRIPLSILALPALAVNFYSAPAKLAPRA